MSQNDRPTIPGQEFYRIRKHLNLTRDSFAIELGYEGNRKGNLKTIKRFETGERAVPLPVAKLAWLLMQNGLPDWPSGLEAVVSDDDAGDQT